MLRGLRKDHGNSAYLPFLLGNLYFDKRWWTVALGEYRTAIAKNAAYRNNGTLVRNVIRMMASATTLNAARTFITGKIGKPAIPYLKHTTATSTNANLKWHAAATLRAMGIRP
jgi:hypothetical protein